MNPKRSPWFVSLIFLYLMGISYSLFAADTLSSENISLNQVREKIALLKKKENIEESVRLSILNIYYNTEDNLEELGLLNSQLLVLQNQLKQLPNQITQLKQRIEEKEAEKDSQKQENFSHYRTEEIEQRLLIEKNNLNELYANISFLENQIAEKTKQSDEIREQLSEFRNRRDEINKNKQLLQSISNPLEAAARELSLNTQLEKVNVHLKVLDLENIVLPLQLESQKLELQLSVLQENKLSNLVKQIDELLISLRQKEIDKVQMALSQVLKQAVNKAPIIQEVAQKNLQYHQLLVETNKNIEQYTAQKNTIESLYKQLEKDFQNAEKKINLAGLSPALGNHLREQRRHIPQQKQYKQTFEDIQKELARAGLEIYQLEEKQQSVKEIEKNYLLVLDKEPVSDSDMKEKLRVRSELRELLGQQKEQITKLGLRFSEYSKVLADLDFNLNQLVALGEKYNAYLNERLLWIPSAPVIDAHYLFEITDSIIWFVQPSHWRQLGIDFKDAVSNSFFYALLAMLLISLLFWFNHKIKLALNSQLKKTQKLYTDKFSYTFSSLGYVILLSLPQAFLLFAVGYLITLNQQAADFSHAVGIGLMTASVPLLLIQFFYKLFKPMGVVAILFNWHEENTLLIYKLFKWLRFVIVPCIFVIGMFTEDTFSMHSNSLGRIALIFAMLALAYMLHRFLQPNKGLARNYYQQAPDSWITRLNYIWYALLVSSPLIIIGFAVAGYYQSALELEHKLIIMLRLLFFSVLLHEIIMRGMVLANRQLALQNARQKRKQQEQAENKDKASAVEFNTEELLLDIPKINEQNTHLLSATIVAILVIGSWLSLRDILPALSIFNKVVLWQNSSIVDGKDFVQQVTLINLFAGMIYLLLMMVFIRNFSGLIDLILAGRYSMTPGGRYALIQLTRYGVIAVSFIAIANELGGSWSQVQWLVAALSVGLGFGLQEIFANMVSGVILLFERPIRVGDTVTVGDVSGKVARIQMRATTIIDWDQKELIVPNKTFITERLVNWTLTDNITRVVVPIGVSYDSDDELVQQLLDQVVHESPLVLKEPEPSVLFVGLGESSLDYHVRLYVRELADRLPAQADINKRVRKIFKEHGIEIPYPQRDLHIRSSEINFSPS